MREPLRPLESAPRVVTEFVERVKRGGAAAEVGADAGTLLDWSREIVAAVYADENAATIALG